MRNPLTANDRVLLVPRASGSFGALDDQALRDLAGFLELQFVSGGNVVYLRRAFRQGDQVIFVTDADGSIQMGEKICEVGYRYALGEIARWQSPGAPA